MGAATGRHHPAVGMDSAIDNAYPPFYILLMCLLGIRFSLDRTFGLINLKIGSLSITPGILFNLAFVMFAMILIFNLIFSNRTDSKPLIYFICLWCPFLLSLLSAVLYSPSIVEGIKFFWNVLTYSLIFFLGFYYSKSVSINDFSNHVIYTGIAPIAVSIFYGFVDGAHSRLYGATSHPNILAFFLFFYICFCFHAILWGWVKSSSIKAVAIIFCAIAVLELLYTGTRSAFVALYVFILFSSLRRPYLLLILIPAPLVAMFIPMVHDRIMEVANANQSLTYEYLAAVAKGDVDMDAAIVTDSGTWRKFLWQAAWPVMMQAPLLGYGVGSFQKMSLQFFDLGFDGGVGAHNIYVQILFEQGFVGLACYIALIIGIVGICLKNFNKSRSMSVFVILIILTFGVASFSDNMLYYLIDQIYIWIVVGFFLGKICYDAGGRTPYRVARSFTPADARFRSRHGAVVDSAAIPDR